MNYRILLKNAIANVVRSSAAAFVALILPPFLTRFMSSDIYGTWSLVLQLSAYVGYLDFGIQTAIARFVAHANELNDSSQRDRILSTSFAILTMMSIIGLVLVCFLAWQLPNFFRGIPSVLYNDARLTLLFVGGSLSVGLPVSVFIAIFIGLQRNEIPASIIGFSKIIGAIIVILIAKTNNGIVLMGVALAVVNLVTYLVQFIVARHMIENFRISYRLVSKQTAYKIISYCLSLMITTVTMLMVSGLDTTFVAYFDFGAIAYYVVATSLVTFIIGIQASLTTILIPAGAVLDARKDAQRLGEMLISATRYCMFLLLLTGLPLIFGAHIILSIWVGESYAVSSEFLLQMLVVANIIRLSLASYAALLIGTDQQKLALFSPIAEGCSNLIISLVAGALFGAAGVAVGTLVGAIVGVACHFIISMPRSVGILVDRRVFIIEGFLRPLLCTMPVFVLVLATPFFMNARLFVSGVWMITAETLAIIIFWHWGIPAVDRRRLLSIFA